MQGDARNKSHDVHADSMNAVVIFLRIHDALGAPKASPGSQPPQECTPPVLLVADAIIDQDGNGLTKFLAQPDTGREANEAGDESTFRIESHTVRRANEREEQQY